jgi:Polyketide cyclase / dehydrase and lipid transport
VWSTLTDLRRMPQWSPELVRMVPLKRGGLREGQWYLGINRRGVVVWPTRSVVSALDPGQTLAWDTKSSGARWIYEVQPVDGGSRVSLRRPVPRRLTLLSKMFAPALLGGSASHADELEAGMQTTLNRLKTTVENG